MAEFLLCNLWVHNSYGSLRDTKQPIWGLPWSSKITAVTDVPRFCIEVVLSRIGLKKNNFSPLFSASPAVSLCEHWVPALVAWNKSFSLSKCNSIRQPSQNISVVLGFFFLKYKKPSDRNSKPWSVSATVWSGMESALPVWATSLASSSSACCQSVVISGSCFGVGPGEPSRVQCYSHTILWALLFGILSVARSLELVRRTCHSQECSSIHTTPTDWRMWSKLSSESSFLWPLK